MFDYFWLSALQTSVLGGRCIVWGEGFNTAHCWGENLEISSDTKKTTALVYWLDWEKGLGGRAKPREAWLSIGHEVHSAWIFAAGAAAC